MCPEIKRHIFPDCCSHKRYCAVLSTPPSLSKAQFPLSGIKTWFRLSLYCKGGEALEKLAQRSCGCHIPGSGQGQVGWSSGPCSSRCPFPQRGDWTRWSLPRDLPTQPLWESVILFNKPNILLSLSLLRSKHSFSSLYSLVFSCLYLLFLKRKYFLKRNIFFHKIHKRR